MTEPATPGRPTSHPAANGGVVTFGGRLTVLVAAVAVAGWLPGAHWLSAWWPGSVPMAPSTAIALLVLGAAILVPWPAARIGAGIATASIAAIGLIQIIAGTSPTVDAWLVPHPGRVADAPTGRMSPLTAVLLFAAATAVATLGARRERSLAGDIGGVLASLLGMASFVLVLGYVYGTPFLYGGTVVPVALPTAVAFAALSVGLVGLAGPEQLPQRPFRDGSSRARLLRAFLPIAPAIILADGVLFRFVPVTNPAAHSALVALAIGLVVALGVARGSHVVGHAFDQAKRERRDRALAEQDALERARLLAESQEAARIASYRANLLTGTWTASAMLDEILGIRDPTFPRTASAVASNIHPDDLEEMSAYFAEDVVRRGNRFDREFRIRRLDDDREVWVHGLGELTIDEDGRPAELVGTIQDVTAAKAAEARLLLAEKLEGVGRLAGGIAHDFNNLLGVITGHAEMTLKDLATNGEPARTRLTRILDAAERGARLSRQLLAFSRRQMLQPQVLDLNAALRDLTSMLERVVGEHVEIESRPAADLGAVRADPTQIERVVMNLVINARDAMQGGGRLTIETANAEVDSGYEVTHPPMPSGRYVVIIVSDTGAGMDEETRKHIFEPFFTTKPVGEGTGLGLATVYGIVKQSGGYIWVYSEPGVGTTFKIYLPRVDEALEPSAGELHEVGAASNGTETVLVVEDSGELRELVAETLEASGYAVLTAADGEAALAVAAAHPVPIDLLLADVVMPKMSGPELGRRLAKVRPAMKQAFMSGYPGGAVSREALLPHDAGLLEKPFTRDALLRVVRSTLDRPPARNG